MADSLSIWQRAWHYVEEYAPQPIREWMEHQTIDRQASDEYEAYSSQSKNPEMIAWLSDAEPGTKKWNDIVDYASQRLPTDELKAYNEYVAETRQEDKSAEQSWRTDMGESYMADVAHRQGQQDFFNNTASDPVESEEWVQEQRDAITYRSKHNDFAEMRADGTTDHKIDEFFAKHASVDFEQERSETIAGQGALPFDQQVQVSQERTV